MKRPRILLAGLFHETNTFVEEKTGLDAFCILRDAELLATRGDGSPLGSVVEWAEEHDWRLIPTVSYRAMPGGMVEKEVVETFWREFSERALPALREGVDGIYLVLHGAMVAESCRDVEGEILERLRALPGAETLPLFGVFDLHANFSPRMGRLTTGLVAYRENPHTDAAEAAIDAAVLLNRCLTRNCLPRTYTHQLPIIWPPTGTGTASDPMASLEKAARRLEKEGHWAVNIIAGFAHADTPDTGVCFSIVTDLEKSCVEAAFTELERIALTHCEQGTLPEWKLEAALDAIISSRLSGPTLLVEPADNIGGGAPGDGTTVLRALVQRGDFSAGVILNDPEAVRLLESMPLGEKVWLSLGGKGSRLDPGPLKLEVELVQRSSGIFELEDRQSHLASMGGTHVDMGACATVRHGKITILLTSRKTPPFDLGQWRSQSIDPAQFDLIDVKAAVAHRRAYDRIAAASYTVDTPGPCSSNLTALPFHHVRRPIFPLDLHSAPLCTP